MSGLVHRQEVDASRCLYPQEIGTAEKTPPAREMNGLGHDPLLCRVLLFTAIHSVSDLSAFSVRPRRLNALSN